MNSADQNACVFRPRPPHMSERAAAKKHARERVGLRPWESKTRQTRSPGQYFKTSQTRSPGDGKKELPFWIADLYKSPENS